MDRKTFIDKANDIKSAFIDARFERFLNYVIDNRIIELENVPSNYGAVYPAIAAFLECVAWECNNPKTNRTYRKDKKITKKIKYHFLSFVFS